MKKLVIFDLDGTLVDTIADLGQAANHVMEAMGLPKHTVEEYKLKVGNGINKLLLRSLPEDYPDKESALEHMRSLFIPYYDKHNLDLSRPYEGIPELLTGLEQRGIMMAVASNKYLSATEKVINTLFPTTPFISVLGQRENVPIKPDPRIVYDTLEVAGVGKDEVLYVGDTMVDAGTARNAGVDLCAVSWGFRPRKELEEACPLKIADRPDEILELVDSLNRC